MNHSTELNFRLRASRFAIVAMTFLFIAALCVPTLSAQIVAPAGSVIGNQATATYQDSNNVSRTAFSNLVQTTVTQVYSGTLATGLSKYATPGSQVYFPHTYQNTGNGPDSVAFTTSAVSGSFTSGSVHIYIDANGDGIPDNTTDLASTTLPIASGASLKVVVVATLAPGTGAGSYALTLTGTSHSATPANTDTVTESAGGVINVTKSMSAPVGGISTVTLNYTNTGNAIATAVTILDPLKTEGYFTYNANSASWNGVTFTDVSGGSTGLAWTGVLAAANAPQAVIASVAPGVSGNLTYTVTVGVPASYPATFTNYAQYNYNDGVTGVVPGAASYINTNTVALAFNGSAAVKFTSSTPAGQYTAGTPETNKIASAAYTQGAMITWSQVLTNQGQVTDTYNLTLDPNGAGTSLNPSIAAASRFPTGTTFQLYRADGKTPVTDSNGDGIVDGGPLAANGTVTVVVAATLPSGSTISGSTTYIVNLLATSTNATASNYVTPGLQDGIQDEVVISNTKNTTVDLAANAGNTVGNGLGVSGESITTYNGNPGVTIAVPFWLFNTTAAGGAPDAYNLSFLYNGTAAVGNLSTPLTQFGSAGSVPPAIVLTNSTIPAWTVLIAPNTGSSCSTYGAPVTASSVIAAAGNAEYCLLLQVPASYASATYHFTIQAQSNSTGALDQMAVEAQVKSYDNVSISPSNQGQIYAGGTVVYKHVVTNGGNTTETNIVSLGTPGVQATPAGWTVSAYLDSTNLGQMTSAATSITTPYSIPALAPGASITYFIVVQAPSSANSGDQQVVNWALTLAGNSSAANVSVTDTSTVITGQVKLVKSQWVDTPCTHLGLPPYSTANGSATSGQCVMYQIVATNTGTSIVTGVTFADAAPAYTTYLGAYVPTATNTCTLTNPTVAALSGTAPFSYVFAGSMTPACTATVTFEVKLN